MSDLTEFREAKDDFYKHGDDSPLTKEQKAGFHSLKYFEENPSLELVLEVKQYDSQEVVEMQTSTGDVAQYIRWGKISFEVDGEPAELTIYRDEDGESTFLPFADATSGKETYGSGRYLEVEQLHDGRMHVDFNYAYNPYCAYNERWSCPLTPFENRLKVPIKAGEKIPQGI